MCTYNLIKYFIFRSALLGILRLIFPNLYLKVSTAYSTSQFGCLIENLNSIFKIKLIFAFFSKLFYPVFPISMDGDSTVLFCQKPWSHSWLLSLFTFHIHSTGNLTDSISKHTQILTISHCFHHCWFHLSQYHLLLS